MLVVFSGCQKKVCNLNFVVIVLLFLLFLGVCMFKVTGVSRCKGSFKVRFANDMTRVKILIKTGHDEIEMVELPAEADKAGCVNFLKTSPLYNRPEFKDAIDAADAKYNGDPLVKVTNSVKPAKPAKIDKSTKPSLEAIKARALKADAVASTQVDESVSS